MKYTTKELVNVGLFSNMPAHEYHAIDAASNSTLSRMMPTPAHCKAHMENPPAQTEAMAFGSLVHTMILEPDLFSEQYAVRPEGIDRRTKQGKEDFAQFELEAHGKTIITAFDLQKAKAMQASFKSNAEARDLVFGGKAELSAFWEDGGLCKCRFDYVNAEGVIVDLKTTADASEKGFSRSIEKFGYYRQAAMYSDGYEQVFGERPKKFVFIALETKPPFQVAVYELDQISIEVGGWEYQKLLREFQKCKQTGIWPGYEGVHTISLPNWKLAEYDNDLVGEIV